MGMFYIKFILEKLTDPQAVKFPTFHGTWRFITIFM